MSTTPDVRPAEVALLMLRQYAEAHGHGHRTVQRAIAEGRLPGAEQDARGRWWIPQDAPILDRPRGDGASAALELVAAPTPDVRPAYFLPALVPLEVAAERMGTTVGAVRRMGDAGLLEVGRYGPRGALRVVLEPR